MFSVGEQWNPKQAQLKEIILKPDKFEQAIKLCLDMHCLVHTSEMSGMKTTTYEDQIWEGLAPEVFRTQIKDSGSTIAWNLWHLTRIEDLTANLLIAEENQCFNSNWLERINISICDTGNAMTDEEIAYFSTHIDMMELRNYRIEVGRKTQKIIKSLKQDQLKRKIRPEAINRVRQEGGVTEAEQSRWLLDFWGKKTVAGILLMPITRHQIVHINDSAKIKKSLENNIIKRIKKI
ncbi:MAG: hypothetical protein K0R50_3760 [Eubacterium sp.]|nr:hypothetical protein [Eubacterium sp.]